MSNIWRLEQYGLKESDLKKLNNQVRVQVMFSDKIPVKPLLSLSPAERKQKLRAFLDKQAVTVLKKYKVTGVEFSSDEKVNATLTLPAHQVVKFANEKVIRAVMIKEVLGLKEVKLSPVSNAGWYLVAGLFCVQTKGQTKGMIEFFERTYIVFAKSKAEAIRKTKKQWRGMEEPFLGFDYRIARYKFVEITDVTVVGEEDMWRDKDSAHWLVQKGHQRKIGPEIIWK